MVPNELFFQRKHRPDVGLTKASCFSYEENVKIGHFWPLCPPSGQIFLQKWPAVFVEISMGFGFAGQIAKDFSYFTREKMHINKKVFRKNLAIWPQVIFRQVYFWGTKGGLYVRLPQDFSECKQENDRDIS